MKSIIRSASLLAAFFIPVFALAALGTPGTEIYLIKFNILSIVNDILVPVLFALAFIVFLYGVANTYIFSTGDEGKVKEGHKLILWGIVGFVVMISLWGLVNVVANTFGLGGAFAPDPPRSTNNYGPGY